MSGSRAGAPAPSQVADTTRFPLNSPHCPMAQGSPRSTHSHAAPLPLLGTLSSLSCKLATCFHYHPCFAHSYTFAIWFIQHLPVFLVFVCLFCFFRAILWHMEVPRLGVESELQQPAYTTATAMRDPSCVYNLHHSSWQRWILNPLSGARDGTLVLTDASQILNSLSHNRNSPLNTFYVPGSTMHQCPAYESGRCSFWF